MPNTAAIGGLSLTQALQSVVKNPAADAKIRTYEVRFVNIDGSTYADVTQCVLIDASAANAQRPVLPVNARVNVRDAISTRITLDPGDDLQAAASAPSDIYALVQKVYEEAAN
jgi:hypothetical protein